MDRTQAPLGFEELLEHSDWVRRLAHRLVGDAARADDLVQEAWLKALESPPRHTANLRAWFGTLVTSLAKSEWRSDKRRSAREQLGSRSEAQPPADQLVHEAQLSSQLVQAIAELQEPYKTVLLMRYFRDWKPARIAGELRRPIATVRTQLQRGLEQLRSDLDGRFGDRRNWCLGLLPLARGGAPAMPLVVPTTASVAVVLIAALVWTAAPWRDSGEPMHAPAAPGLEPNLVQTEAATSSTPPSLARDAERVSNAASRIEESAPAGEASNANAPSAPRYTLTGRLLDLDGKGQGNVRLRWIDPSPLRWLDETRTLIHGPDTWVPIRADLRESLANDPVAREEFVRQNFRRPELAEALLTDRAAPVFEARCNGEGRFTLQVPERTYSIELDDPLLDILGRSETTESSGENVMTWFVVERRSLHGVVVDHRGLGVPAARVIATSTYPERLQGKLALGSGLSSRRFETSTDDAGRFQFENQALGRRPRIEALAVGKLEDSVQVELPADAEEAVESLTLVLHPTTEPLRLHGCVRLDDGSPAPRATVVLGGALAITDGEGRYELLVDGELGDLYATRAGCGIAHAPRAAEGLAEAIGAFAVADLDLPRSSLAIEGRVLDESGRSVREASVWLYDGVDVPRESRKLEDVAAGRQFGKVETDSEGRFRIDGLTDRDYRLRVSSGTRDLRTRPLRAGERNVRIVLR